MTEQDRGVIAAWRTLAPLMDLVTPMALRVAVTLGLADFMPDDGAGHGAAAGDLAERAGADPEALLRVLRHLVQHGVFTEPRPGEFAVNAVAALLRSGEPASLWLDLDGFGGQMDLAFTGMAHTVRTGEPAWEQVFGLPFWQYLDENPAISASFDATMAVDSDYRAAIADGFDWSAARHIADVGGGTGPLIAEILRHHPRLRGTLIDLPETADRARQYLAGLGLSDRCEVAGQSFFDPLPAGADAYLLNRVIHDWDDASASAILRRCAEAAGSDGRVLMIESQDTGSDPAGFAEMNLRMLVLTGGRERTIDDYTALAASAGLRVAGVHRATKRHMIIETRAVGLPFVTLIARFTEEGSPSSWFGHIVPGTGTGPFAGWPGSAKILHDEQGAFPEIKLS
ncbi:MAG TPA: methyltransferase [Streptosporangiaceae bacterium]